MMTNYVRFAKWALLIVGIGWAVFSANGFIFLARAFPSQSRETALSEILASAQGYAVVFGPAALAVVLLVIQWPKKKSKDRRN